jgi:hypothetical protein
MRSAGKVSVPQPWPRLRSAPAPTAGAVAGVTIGHAAATAIAAPAPAWAVIGVAIGHAAATALAAAAAAWPVIGIAIGDAGR